MIDYITVIQDNIWSLTLILFLSIWFINIV